MGAEDSYTAFCFDEACAYIHMEIVENKKEPNFNVFKENGQETDAQAHYTRPSDFYNKVKGVSQ